MLDPNLIRRDMTPDQVLRAMLPVVQRAFALPSSPVDPIDCRDKWVFVFASHVLPALMMCAVSPLGIGARPIEAALTAFRDAWCDAWCDAAEARRTTEQLPRKQDAGGMLLDLPGRVPPPFES